MSDMFDDQKPSETDPFTAQDHTDTGEREEDLMSQAASSEETSDGENSLAETSVGENNSAETSVGENNSAETTAGEVSPAETAGGENGPADPGQAEASQGQPPADRPEEHDFDDEPLFDTRTGERLDKPKSKAPGILLTLAVTASLAGGIAAAFLNRDRWNTGDAAPLETEAALTVSSETDPAQASPETTEETSSEPAAGETKASEAEPSETKKASGPEETEGLSKTEETESRQTEDRAPAGGKEDVSSKLREELGRGAVSLNTSLDVSDMVEKALPSLVSVTSQSVRTVESFFYGEQQIRTSNVGSGILIGEDEDHIYIVTDAYLAARAQEMTVGFAGEGTGGGRKLSSGDREETGRKDPQDGGGQEDQTEQDPAAQREEDAYLTGGSSDQEDDLLVSADLVGTDAGTELAVLSVDRKDLPQDVQSRIRIAEMGDSDKLQIGQRAVAIGDALGYGQSVTQGIISALGRTMKSAYGTHAYIQTDASINYGNYGGALLNLDGQVIGINAGKVTQEAAEGMGYALPAKEAMEGISRILGDKASFSKGQSEQSEQTVIQAPSAQTDEEETEGAGTREDQTARPGMLGVHVAQVSEENRIIYRLPEGLYVASVDPGSGALNAGIQAGDLITKVDGQEVASIDKLRRVLADKRAGDSVEVDLIHPDEDGKYAQVSQTKVILQ